jgi:hypothetical protein
VLDLSAAGRGCTLGNGYRDRIAISRLRVLGSPLRSGRVVTNTPDDDDRVRGSEPLSEPAPMIRRALLIAVAAVTMSAAAAMAFTPALARASRSWTRDILRTTFGRTIAPASLGGEHPGHGALPGQGEMVEGAFCPIRPPEAEQTPLISGSSATRMSTDAAPGREIDSPSRSMEDSLLPAAPEICRASPATTPQMQSTDRR